MMHEPPSEHRGPGLETQADPSLLVRARGAYERGRVALGLLTASSVLPMAVLSFLACGRPAATVSGAFALVVLVATAVWRGQDAGRGARLGLLAGVPPLLLPVVVRTTGHLCSADVCFLFPFACLAGGLIGGLVLGVFGVRAKLGPTGIAVAGVAAGLAGSLGCIVAGAIGVVVLVLGLAGGLAPALACRKA
jgi:hypothetical protein